MRREQDDGRWDGWQVVHDDPATAEGPLRGVVCGLRAVRAPWAWVLACDQPMLTPAVLSALLAEARPDDVAVVPVWAGRWQPLTALVRTDARGPLQQQIDQGQRSLIDALRAIGARPLPEAWSMQNGGGGQVYTNINRREDLERLDEG